MRRVVKMRNILASLGFVWEQRSNFCAISLFSCYVSGASNFVWERNSVIFILGLLLVVGFFSAAGGQESSGFQGADKERMIQTVRFLSEDCFPRSDSLEQRDRVVAFLENRFVEAGLETSREEFSVLFTERQRALLPMRSDRPDDEPVPCLNLYAMKKGGSRKRIIVTGHFDAVAGSPGADDNASALAVLLELAFLLKKTDLSVDVELAAYDVEEIGCLGSEFHAATLQKTEVSVVVMVAMDLVGYYSEEENSQAYPVPAMSLLFGTKGDKLAIIGRVEDAPFLEIAKKAYKSAGDLKTAPLIAPPGMKDLLSRSDHSSFWAKGFPAIFLTDTAEFRNKNYHQPTDTWDTLDYDRLVKVADGLFAAIVAFSQKEE